MKTTFENWMKENLDDTEITDLSEHGADTGWGGLTYTADLVELHDKFEEEIWEALADDVENFGYKSIPEFVATFNRIDMANTADGFKALLVWYMAEHVARQLTDNE